MQSTKAGAATVSGLTCLYSHQTHTELVCVDGRQPRARDARAGCCFCRLSRVTSDRRHHAPTGRHYHRFNDSLSRSPEPWRLALFIPGSLGSLRARRVSFLSLFLPFFGAWLRAAAGGDIQRLYITLPSWGRSCSESEQKRSAESNTRHRGLGGNFLVSISEPYPLTRGGVGFVGFWGKSCGEIMRRAISCSVLLLCCTGILW